MAISSTQISNMALARIGALRINNLTDGSPQAIQCNTHYAQTRDALMRSHWWRFASARRVLAQDDVDPAFEWDNQFILPADFLRLKDFYADNNTPTHTITYTYAIEGDRLLTDEDAVSIRYIRRVEDVSKFDPLFVEVLVLELAMKLVMPLSRDKVLRRDLQDEFVALMRRVRTVDRSETSRVGRADSRTWVDSRIVGV